MEDIGTCQSLGCGKPAKQICPKCLQAKLPPAGFCTQECFKSSWNNHRMNVHPDTSKDSTLPERFIGYQFAGKIRPGIISPKRSVPDHIKKPDYAESGEPLAERQARRDVSIDVKTPQQIEIMRNLGKLGREVLDLAGTFVKPGVRTDELDKVVHEACIERGAYPSPLNYKGFPKSVCTSVNEIICHGIPDSRKLEDGDIVNLDVSLYKDGMHIDLNETYLCGNVDDNGKKLVQTTREALDEAIKIVKPGTQYREVGNVISKHVQKQGFSVVVSYCGHGVGTMFHSNPSIPHYGRNKAVGVMKPGHIFTIEPMINEGKYQDETWPDDWTSTTKDGKRSAQFEHTILVTETGYEVLTAKQ